MKKLLIKGSNCATAEPQFKFKVAIFPLEVFCISYLAGGLDPLPDAEVDNGEDEQQTEG